MNHIYHFNEGILSLPVGYDDETSIALVWPQSEAFLSPFSLTIEKESINNNDLVNYVEEQINALKDELDDFREIDRNETTIDNQKAIEVKFTWCSDDDEKIVQRQAFVIHNGTALIFNGTMMGKFVNEGDKKWKNILNSFIFRRDNNDA